MKNEKNTIDKKQISNEKLTKKIKDNPPLNLIYINLSSDKKEEELTEKELFEVKFGYSHGSLFYDKYSKRIIYFNSSENSVYIYNRSKTSLKKKINVVFNFKVLNACVDKKLTFLLILANPNLNNKFIFVYCIAKETFFSQLKEDFSYLLNMFFIEENVFCLVFVNEIKFYLCSPNNDEVKQIKSLDYNKILIKNFFFVRQYLVLLIDRFDNSFDMYSLRKREVELIKNFNEVFNTRSVMFKSSSKGSFFSNLFSSKTEYLKTQRVQLMNNYNNVYSNIYKTSQCFLEYIYTNLYFILLSYEDNAIFLMKIKNINKFPKEEEGNQILKIEYRSHSNNSTLQFMDNLIFAHNFTTNRTIIFDLELKSKTKIVCFDENILNSFQDKIFHQIKVVGGNFEKLCKIKNEKNQQEITKKYYSVNLDLENLFKSNGDRMKNKKINEDQNELDTMLMISRRNKSKIFFLELFNKMLLDKTIKNRTDKIKLLLNEFSRQIQKSNSLALDLMNNINLMNEPVISPKSVKLGYKRDNEKFYLDDKYIMLSTKNTLSQIEVIKPFKIIGETKDIGNTDEESLFEYLIYILFFCIQLNKNKIDLIKLYHDTIFILFKQIKREETMIKFITYFSNNKYFPFTNPDIAKYLLENFSHPLIRLEGYKILQILGLYNELFYYLLKHESFSYAIKYLEQCLADANEGDIKKIILEYINNYEDKALIREIINEFINE